MSRGWEQRAPKIAAFVVIAIAVLGTACATSPRPAAAPGLVPGIAAADAEAASGEAADDPDDGTASGSDRSDRSDREEGAAESELAGPCPADMALVEMAAPSSPSPRRFCVDKYEASLVEVLADGTERPFPHYLPVDGHDVRAMSKPHAFPQGYVSEVQAQDACAASGKRLCSMEEWKTACMGPSRTTFPYGDARRPGACHDTGKSAVIAVFGAKAVAASTPYAPAPVTSAAVAAASGKRAHTTKGRAAQSTRPRASGAKSTGIHRASRAGAKPSANKLSRHAGRKGADSKRPSNVDPGVWARLNDPGLGQVDGALAKTGEHDECVNGFGVFDMVGNLHEWVATDPKTVHGTFAGGYYLDTTLNGDGCNYRTVAHAHDYHDYSTGFRCCAPTADAQPAPSASRGP
jgi:hypothetical protein